MLAASATTEKYRCPGESYSITASVHLSRLAAFYSKCRQCPHAPGAPATVGSASDTAPTTGSSAPIPTETALFTGEGVRGRYLNELTRSTAAEMAGAFASRLWDIAGVAGVPPVGGLHAPLPSSLSEIDLPLDNSPTPPPAATEGIRLLSPDRPGPSVVLAHDERPSAPDIVTGVGQALRRMGCQVIDIGVATRPALLFAIDHLQAAGGVQVTGGGCDPGWTGLDFIKPEGIPCSSSAELDQIAARFLGGYSRPTRRPGSQRAFQAMVPYQAGLWKHFHALRPLKIALACSNRAVLDVFQHIFRKLACRLIPVDTRIRARLPGHISDPDVARTSQAVLASSADLGLLMEDDGEQCTFFDDRGTIVPPVKMASLLAEVALADHPGHGGIVVPSAWSTLPIGGREIYVANPTREQITSATRRERAQFAADGQGRYWFAEAYPACDALLTLVHLLQALSRSDTPFSEVVG